MFQYKFCLTHSSVYTGKYQHDGRTNCEVNFTRTMVHRTQLRIAPCPTTSLLQIKPKRYITFFSSTAYLKY